MADRSVRVDVYTPTGQLVGPGPITSVHAASYEQGLGEIGAFALDIPAEDTRSMLIGHGYELRITRGDEGLVFRGIVDKFNTMVGDDDRKVLRVTGASIGRRLVWANTLAGLQFSNSTLRAAVDRLLTLASSQVTAGFTSGAIDEPLTVLEAQRMDGISVWGALVRVAETFALLLREDAINAEIDVGSFGANPRGLRFQNAQQMTAALGASENVFAIADIAEIASSEDVWTRVIPLGVNQGIAGAVPAMNLRYATRTAPYPIVSFTGPDSETQYSMEDYSAQATYGVRTKVLYLKDAAALGLSATDFQGAANTMYDRAATWLARHSTPQTSYAVRVLGMKHLTSDGVPVFSVGDKVRVVYRGVVQDASGGRLWKEIDQSLYIMSYRRSWAGSTDVWDFVLSNIPRQVDDDGNRSVQLLEQVSTLQSVPSPFIMLASAALRADKYGLQARRLSGQYPLEAISGNYGGVPVGNEDIDLIADGVINILDLSYASATYPPRRSGSIIWHGESDFVDGAIPGSMFAGTGGDPLLTRGTPGVQGFIQGLAAKIPNGSPLTESVETSHGVHGTWGIAGFGAHQNKTTTSQADATLRAQNIGATLVAGFDVKAKADNTALVKLLGALAQGPTAKAQITSNQNDYDIGAKTSAAFAINSDAARDITGILATSVADGTLLFIQNVGAFTITLKDESASSSAANRFALTGDIALGADAGVILQYNSASQRWRALAAPGGGGMNKSSGTGQFLIPAGPGTGGVVRAGAANTYGSWAGIARDKPTITGPTVSGAGSGTVTSHPTTMPSCVAGDLLVVIIASNLPAANHNTPAGWTLGKSLTNGNPSLFCFYKVADGSESGGSVDFSTTAVAQDVAHVFKVATGTYEGTPDFSTGATATSTNGNPDVVTFTQTGRHATIAALMLPSTTVATGGPAGYSGFTATATSSSTAIATAYLDTVNSHTEDPGTFTNTSQAWAAFTVGIRASPAVASDTYLMGLSVVPSGSPAYIQVQLATGAIGAESIIGTFDLLAASNWRAGSFAIPVAANARVSCRIATDLGAANHNVKLTAIAQGNVV